MRASDDEVVVRAPTWILLLALIVVLAMFGACVALPVGALVAAAGLTSRPVMASLIGLGVGVAGWFIVRPILGSRKVVLSADGIRFRAHLWDTRRLLLRWDAIALAWFGRDTFYNYLYVLPHDVNSFVTGGRIRRAMLSSSFSQFGTPFMVYVPGGDAAAATVRDAVRRFSGGAVNVTDRRPPASRPPFLVKRPAAAAALADGRPTVIEACRYRTPRRLWLLPVALFAGAVPFGVAGALTGLLAVWMLAAMMASAGAVSVWWRGGSTTVDESGFSVGEQHVPWWRITAVRVESIDRWHLVKLDVGGSETVIARGLADHPPGDPDFAAKLAEVRAACAGRVPFEQHRRGVMPTAVGVAIVVLGAVAYAAASTDHPWHRAWWPWVDIAVDTPDPCAALVTATANRLVLAPGRPQAQPVPDSNHRHCRLDGESDRLDVTVELHGPGRTHPVEAAERTVRSIAQTAGLAENIADVGDAAIGGVASDTVLVTARRANVVVIVTYLPGTGREHELADDWAGSVAIAESVLASVDVR